LSLLIIHSDTISKIFPAMLIEYINHLEVTLIPTLKSSGWIFVGMPFFLILERIFPAQTNQNIKGIFHNIGISLLLFTANFLTSFFAGLIAANILSYFNAPIFNFDLAKIVEHQSGMAKVLIASIFVFAPLFIFDFFYYWFHRSQHQIPILWLQHKFHHSDEDLNVTTVHRHHWLEEIYRTILIFIPMGLLIKLNPYTIFWVSFLLGYWSHFFHSNIRLHLGWIGLFFMGPQAHRVHHSILTKHRDKNFAAFFPIWDIIFGTYYHPNKNEFPPTGVQGEASRPRWDYLIFEPLFGIARLIKKKL